MKLYLEKLKDCIWRNLNDHLQKIECSIELFEGGVDTAAVVVVEQEVEGVELAVLLTVGVIMRMRMAQQKYIHLEDEDDSTKVQS